MRSRRCVRRRRCRQTMTEQRATGPGAALPPPDPDLRPPGQGRGCGSSGVGHAAPGPPSFSRRISASSRRSHPAARLPSVCPARLPAPSGHGEAVQPHAHPSLTHLPWLRPVRDPAPVPHPGPCLKDRSVSTWNPNPPDRGSLLLGDRPSRISPHPKSPARRHSPAPQRGHGDPSPRGGGRPRWAAGGVTSTPVATPPPGHARRPALAQRGARNCGARPCGWWLRWRL